MQAERPARAVISAALALVCIALAYAPAILPDTLALDRPAIGQGAFWRLWTAHVVHFSVDHAALNAIVLFVTGLLVERHAGPRFLLLSVSVGAVLVSAGLLFATPLAHYRGASGLATLLALEAGVFLWQSTPTRRPLLLGLAGAYALKTGLEASGTGWTATSLPPDVHVAWQAHVFGALSAVALLATRAKASALARSLQS